jgi:hypothetical protein
MMRAILALMALAAMASPAAAQTPLQKCKVITDTIERLQCYDAIEESAAPPASATAAPAATKAAPPAQAAKSAAPAEELIAKAKASVTGQLRDPNSARFAEVKVRTVRGTQAVCGLINAKNAMGIMTGPQPFAFDGEKAYLVILQPGSGQQHQPRCPDPRRRHGQPSFEIQPALPVVDPSFDTQWCSQGFSNENA